MLEQFRRYRSRVLCWSSARVWGIQDDRLAGQLLELVVRTRVGHTQSNPSID